MITHIPRSSFSANINNTAQTNEHQTLSELFYKELEDKIFWQGAGDTSIKKLLREL